MRLHRYWSKSDVHVFFAPPEKRPLRPSACVHVCMCVCVCVWRGCDSVAAVCDGGVRQLWRQGIMGGMGNLGVPRQLSLGTYVRRLFRYFAPNHLFFFSKRSDFFFCWLYQKNSIFGRKIDFFFISGQKLVSGAKCRFFSSVFFSEKSWFCLAKKSIFCFRLWGQQSTFFFSFEGQKPNPD